MCRFSYQGADRGLAIPVQGRHDYDQTFRQLQVPRHPAMPMRILKHPLTRHSARLSMEIMGILLGIVTILIVGLTWRLAQGPIRLDDMTPMLVQALTPSSHDVEVSIGDTVLSWNSERRGIDLVARRVEIRDARQHLIASIPEIATRFSPLSLVTLQPRPSRLVLYQPFVRMRRWQDGHISLALGEQPTAVSGDATDSTTGSVSAEDDSLETLIALIEGRARGTNPFAALRQLQIDRGRLIIDDQISQRQWLASDLAITIRHGRDGLLASAEMALDIPGTKVPVSARLHLPSAAEKGAALFRIGAISPSTLADLRPGLSALKALGMPVGVEAEADFHRDGRLDSAVLALEAQSGTINLPEYYREPLKIDSLKAHMRADRTIGSLWLDDLLIRAQGADIAAKGTVRTDEQGHHLDVDITANGVTPENLVQLWPHNLVPGAHEWIAANISKGKVQNARAHLSFLGRADNPLNPELVDLDGHFDVSGVQVQYHPNLPPVVNATGTAHITPKTLIFENLSGISNSLELSQTRVTIDGFDQKLQHLTVEGNGKGPLRTIMAALDDPHFGYARQIGVDPADVSGVADAQFRFSLPLLANLNIGDVDMLVTGKVTALGLADAVGGLPISGGNMAITLDNNRLLAKGRADIAGMGVDVSWQQSLIRKEKITSQITFNGKADGTVIGGMLGLDQPLVEGPMAIDGRFRTFRDRGADLKLDADVADARFIWPDGLIPVNDPGVAPQKLSLTATRSNKGEWSSDDIHLTGKDISVSAQISGTGQGQAAQIILDPFVFGGSQISAHINRSAEGAILVAINGALLDLDPWFRTPPPDPASPQEEPVDNIDAVPVDDGGGPLEDAVGFPLAIAINVDQMRMGGNVPWQQVTAQFANNGQRWNRLQLKAMIGPARFEINHGGTGAAHRLMLHADNLGGFLASIGIENSLRNGIADIEADVSDQAVRGNVRVKDAFVTDAPALMRLFSVLSSQGLSALDGQTGVRFDTTESKFVWHKGRLYLRDGRANGAQIGITFAGKIDLGGGRNRKIDVEGTIVPVYTLNRLIGAIPIIGDLLTGGNGQGLFAATYHIRGPRVDPQVSVNPLSALAPGIVRRILFMNNDSGNDAPPDPGRPQKPTLAPDERNSGK